MAKSNPADTTISSGIKVKGHLKSSHDVYFDGIMTGHITGQHNVVIGANGQVEGNVESTNLTVRGQVNGNLIVHGSLVIEPGGRVAGDVKAEKLQIADGGWVSGTIIMPTPETETVEPDTEPEPDQPQA